MHYKANMASRINQTSTPVTDEQLPAAIEAVNDPQFGNILDPRVHRQNAVVRIIPL